MSDSNMPILWQNCLHMFTTNIAQKAWIWFAETRGSGMQYQADAYAREVETLVLFLAPALKTANNPHDASDEVLNDLLRFALVRHANLRFGGNVKPHFLEVQP